MRKFDAFLLAVLILTLNACGERPAGTQETAAPPSAVVPSETSGAPKGVLLPNGPLPQSAYAPPSPPPRFYGEITLTLIPRDDYGRIWPYVGGYVVRMWMPGNLIGLCDGSGRIICDPVFNRAEIIEKDGRSLYKLTENREDAEGKDISHITLCKPDGSWAREYEGIAFRFQGSEFYEWSIVQWRPGFTYDDISVCENGKWGVIDYEGREVLPCQYNNPVCFSEGLAAVTSDDGETYTYIDRNGNHVLGPYETPPTLSLRLPFPIYDPLIADVKNQTLHRYFGLFFSEGLARFYENGKYGVIDKSGRIVIPARYDFVSAFSGGTAMIVSGNAEGIERGIIDRTGKVILEPGDNWLDRGPDGAIVLDTPEGPMALDSETGARTPWVNKDPAASASYSQGSNGVVIYWEDGEQSFPEASYVIFLDNGNLALTSRGGESWYIADRHGETAAGPFDGRAEDFRNGFIYVAAGMSGLHDGTDTTYRTLYDRDGNRILPELYREIIPFDGRYLVRQDTCAGLLNEEGNWVIQTMLYDYLND